MRSRISKGDKIGGSALRQQHARAPAPALAFAVVGCAVLLATGAAGQGAAAQGAGTQDSRPDYLRELDDKRGRLQDYEAKAKALDQGVLDLKEERRKLNDQLLETAARIQDSEAKMTSIESRLGELSEQEKMLRGSLAQQHAQIATLLGSLQRMGRNPPPVMMTHRDDALAMVRSAILLATAFPGLRDKATALSARLDELVRVMSDIRSEGERLKAEAQRLKDARIVLSGLMTEKKETITQRQAELKAVQAAAAEISRNVNDLGELIARLDEAVTKNTKLEEYNRKVEADLRAQAAAEASSPAPAGAAPSTPDAQPGPDRKEVALAAPPAVETAQPQVQSAQEKPVQTTAAPPLREPAARQEAAPTEGRRVAILQPKTGAIRRAPTDRIEPMIPFHKAKGQLPPPTRGKRLLSFNEATEYGGRSTGIVFETRARAQITSPCDGWVVYAGEFRSFGQILIINAGGGYHVLLTGLSHIDVQPGQFVIAGEPVGTMGDALAGGTGTPQSGGPPLYVEFRKNDKPIDPDPWWIAAP